ncbi:Disease resistance-like protein DSC1 [Vitis vinifera]|uniref:ADP-ribosyl cyclase/cyclic ADP-ribose hydrolase n=1 Tax=Vitis vinifera TaxID=29760 RepID=A0A438H4Q6_VITVI|nr:Disease resistance-like protein DSC1 [Vitis vinifera]
MEIIDDILKKLNPKVLYVNEDICGKELRLKELKSLLSIELIDDVRMIGIYGIGGIGKTTIAKMVYNDVLCHFKGSSFLEDVKERSKCHHGRLQLLQEFLHGTLMVKDLKLSNIDEGINMIKNRLCRKRILLILDDVDHLDQLKLLVGSCEWFGPGSRIIITTRDKHLLNVHRVDAVYEVKELDHKEAIQLFSRHAFKQNIPPKNYEDLSNCVINYAKGLPLALKVLGLKILCDRCLITISNSKIHMHDLIQQMGQEIVREKYPDDPNKWSRLWDPDDIYRAFLRKEGMKKIEAISLDFSRLKEIQLSTKVFSRMKKLRLLKVYWSDHSSFTKKESKVFIPKDFEIPSHELRYLYWEGYSLNCLPSNFHGENLVELELRYSTIKRLWKGSKGLEKLKFINLSHSEKLTKISKFSGMPNLERLNLEGCTSLRKVHSSLGVLKKLTSLQLKDCQKLESFPSSIELESLEVLDISGCSNFEKFPEIHGNMRHLRKIYLNQSGIKELPTSIEFLESLEMLQLANCSNFEKFPEIQRDMKSLHWLVLEFLHGIYLHGCSNLEAFPDIIKDMENIGRLELMGTSLKELPPSIEHLKGIAKEPDDPAMFRYDWLMFLNGSKSKWLQPDGRSYTSDLWCLSSLRRLNLSGSNIRCIPSGISQLRILQLNHCKMLESITELPSSLRVLDAHDCTRLDTLSSLSSLLQCSLFSCFKSAIQELEHGIESSKSIGINIVIPGSRGIPEWISNQELGSEVTVELPMNWCEDNDFLGFALCSLYVPLDDAFEDGGLECRLIAFHGDQFRRVDDIWFKSSCKYYENGGVSYLHKCCDNGDVSDCVLWVTYYPQIAIKKKHRSNQWRHFKALFNGLYNCGSKAFKVKKCGVHLIYAQDFQPNHYSSQLLRETANCNVKRSRDDTESDPAEGPSHKRLRDLEP